MCFENRCNNIIQSWLKCSNYTQGKLEHYTFITLAEVPGVARETMNEIDLQKWFLTKIFKSF